MKKWVFTMLFLGFCGVLLHAQEKSAAPETAPAAPPSEQEQAIAKVARDYEAAFNKGDAKALGEMFAEDIEYTDEDGVLITGRDDVVALLAKSFVLNPGAKMAIDIKSVKPLGADVAIERGTTLVTSRDGEQNSSAYTAVHARKDGKWHIQQLVESPVPDPSPAEMLSALNWMVGTWKEKDGDSEVETKVNWAVGGNFLTRNFKVTVNNDVALQGFQIVGWDGSAGKIRSWLFDSGGAFQEGVWTQSGKGWLIKQTGVLSDGSKLSSDNVLTRVDDDHCTWEATNRTLDGDPQPNLPRVDMTRDKGN